MVQLKYLRQELVRGMKDYQKDADLSATFYEQARLARELGLGAIGVAALAQRGADHWRNCTGTRDYLIDLVEELGVLEAKAENFKRGVYFTHEWNEGRNAFTVTLGKNRQISIGLREGTKTKTFKMPRHRLDHFVRSMEELAGDLAVNLNVEDGY